MKVVKTTNMANENEIQLLNLNDIDFDEEVVIEEHFMPLE